MMNRQTANPYVSPTTDSPQPATGGPRSLLPAWIWLAVAAIAPPLMAPADPISTFLSLASGLTCFIAGAIQGSTTPPLFLRLVLLLALTFPGASLAFSYGDTSFIIGALVYVAVSAALGFSASRRIPRGRLRILGSFIAGFALGSLLGMVGAVACSIVAAKLAQRSLRFSEPATKSTDVDLKS